MKRTPKYVGLDVHLATTVTAVLEESGRVIARSVVPTEVTAILDFCRRGAGMILRVALAATMVVPTVSAQGPLCTSSA